MILWPRLPVPLARPKAAALAGRNLREIEQEAWSFEAPTQFAPTGGVWVARAAIRSLRKSLEDIARRHGYPSALSRAQLAGYESETMACLVDAGIPLSEALRSETWAWVAVVLVPHLVLWRWPARSDGLRLERFAGPIYRNGLGRLWYQGVALDAGGSPSARWRLTVALGADQQVALFERPSLCADPSVARAVAEGWLRLDERKRVEATFREAMKLLIVKAAVQRLDVLSASAISGVVDEAFRIAAATARAG